VYPFFPQYEKPKDKSGTRRHDHENDMIVFVNYGQHSRWYFVFAKNEDINQGYLSHQGPFTPPNRKRRDVLLNAKAGTRWCSQDREEAQQNRKGCLFGDHFVPFTAPGKDLFLEYIGPLADSERVAQYVESAKWSSYTRQPKLHEPDAEQARIIKPTLVSLLDHNLSEYCTKVARSLAKSHDATISWIWRATKFKTNDKAVVHRTWKARALLFQQLEHHARHTPSSPCILEFTPEIIHLITGLVPSTALPHARSSVVSDGRDSSFASAGESAYGAPLREGNANINKSVLAGGSSNATFDSWPSSPMDFGHIKQSSSAHASSTSGETSVPGRKKGL
jgi:hypothetical protein